jgi:hypothetical protein
MEIDEEDCSLSVGTGELPVMMSCASTRVGELCSPSRKMTTHGLLTLDEPDLDCPNFSAGKVPAGGVSLEKVRHHIRSEHEKGEEKRLSTRRKITPLTASNELHADLLGHAHAQPKLCELDTCHECSVIAAQLFDDDVVLRA